jgi:hypothetical protein
MGRGLAKYTRQKLYRMFVYPEIFSAAICRMMIVMWHDEAEKLF